MPDTQRTLAELLAQAVDNTAGGYTLQDVRDFMISAYPVIHSKTITLTGSEILDLANTAIEIVPAPGVGKVLAPSVTIAHGKPGSTPFNYVGAGSIQLTHEPLLGSASVGIEVYPLGDASGGVGLLLHDSFAYNGQLYDASANVVSFLMSEVEDKPLMLKATFGSAPTVGNGTIDITVVYAEINI